MLTTNYLQNRPAKLATNCSDCFGQTLTKFQKERELKQETIQENKKI